MTETRTGNGEKTRCVHGGKTHSLLSSGGNTRESGATSRESGVSDRSGRNYGNDASESERSLVSYPLLLLSL